MNIFHLLWFHRNTYSYSKSDYCFLCPLCPSIPRCSSLHWRSCKQTETENRKWW